jgi:glycosyltransferase involved in cell wall biosynthesis
MRVGVAIPCYKNHIRHLSNLLQTLDQQTYKPDEVVVSCSSCRPEDLPIFSVSFPLRILTTEQHQNCATNRNKAASALTTDCILFFDADDEMHPQRLEVLRNIFLQTQCDIALHTFWIQEETKQPFSSIAKPNVEVNVLRRSPTGCAVVDGRYHLRIAHGHVSVSAFAFRRIQFKEDPGNERRDDAIFCGDVLSMPGVQSAYIHDSLSKYYPSGTGGISDL